jgi:hypothetical protein
MWMLKLSRVLSISAHGYAVGGGVVGLRAFLFVHVLQFLLVGQQHLLEVLQTGYKIFSS